MERLRVLIADDSATVRERLRSALQSDPGIEVVAIAADGREAAERCLALRPDVVSMDMMMPTMTGLAATEYIMAYCPTPILIVSASFNRGEVFRMYDALAAGAVDVLEKPAGDEPDDAWDRRYLAQLRRVARIRVITHLRGRVRQPAPVAPCALVDDPPARLIALGASTGGPGALVEVLRPLAEARPRLPILVTLHINGQFAATFADWLDAQTPLPAALAEDGAPLAALGGRIVLAPPDRHLLVEAGRIRLSEAPPLHSCRPSVDVLFDSIARDCGGAAIAALLTGMGRDGAAGLLAIRRAGGMTIAQDEATSVVYGMPREAAGLGAARQILPLSGIGPAIAARLRVREAVQ